MDLSPEDRARLDRLMEQHLNGQLSDEEYQRRSWEILRGTDSGAGSRAALRAQSSSNASISQTVSDAELKSIASTPKRKRRNRINETLVPLALVFVFGLALALVVGVLKSTSRRVPIEELVQPQPSPSLSEEQSSVDGMEELYFQPPFGEFAVSSCRKECVDTREGSARKACLRDCKHLKLSKFGRRVSVAPLDAKHDARGFVASCLAKDLNIRRHSSAIGWEEEIEAATYLLEQVSRSKAQASLGGLQTMYGQVLQTVRSLRAPPGGQAREQKLSETLARTHCLHSGSLLAKIGAETAKFGSDNFSVRYYRTYSEEIEESLRQRVPEVVEQARSMGLYSND